MAFRIQAWERSDIGRNRPGNEDASLSDPRRGLFAVADGMGGRAAGEVASQMVIDRVGDQAAELARASRRGDPRVDESHRRFVLQQLRNHLRSTNEDVFEAGRGAMGTTADVLLLSDESAYVGHVGDSRIYLLRDGAITRLTRDHTYAEQLRREGAPQSDDPTSNYQHMLTRCLGVRSEITPDTFFLDVHPGDQFLLCTDGLTRHLDDDELLEIVQDVDTDSEVVERMIDLANTSGGADNITVVYVTVEGPEADEADGAQRDTIRKVQFLEDIDLFADLPRRDILRVLQHVYQRHFDPGEALIEEGDTDGALYVLVRGEVEVRRGDLQIAVLGPGEHVGELTLTSDQPRSADVVATEETEVLALQRQTFLDLVQEGDLELGNTLLWNLLKHCSDRLRETTDKFLV
jgi:serine/threonine protein phosphatase PrpC